jgi:hypothetical protein
MLAHPCLRHKTPFARSGRQKRRRIMAKLDLKSLNLWAIVSAVFSFLSKLTTATVQMEDDGEALDLQEVRVGKYKGKKLYIVLGFRAK